MRWLLSCLALLAAGGALADAGIDQAKKEGEVVWYTALTVLVGHSQSGRVAVDLAIGETQRVAKVVVLGTGSLLPPLAGNSEPAAEGEEGSRSEPGRFLAGE